MTTRGKRPRWNGLRLRRRRTAISSRHLSLIAVLTNIAFPVAIAITRCRTSRWNLPSELAANLPRNWFPYRWFSGLALNDGNSVHNLDPTGHRSLECKDRHLAFSRV